MSDSGLPRFSSRTTIAVAPFWLPEREYGGATYCADMDEARQVAARHYGIDAKAGKCDIHIIETVRTTFTYRPDGDGVDYKKLLVDLHRSHADALEILREDIAEMGENSR